MCYTHHVSHACQTVRSLIGSDDAKSKPNESLLIRLNHLFRMLSSNRLSTWGGIYFLLKIFTVHPIWHCSCLCHSTPTMIEVVGKISILASIHHHRLRPDLHKWPVESWHFALLLYHSLTTFHQTFPMHCMLHEIYSYYCGLNWCSYVTISTIHVTFIA